MKKFINDPNKVVDEMLEGFLLAHSHQVRKLSTSRVVVRKEAPVPGKVGLVSGGGSGHKPTFIGYIGRALLDAVAVGEVFSSPSAGQFYDAIKAVDSGEGVICIYGNYSGDIMNVEMAMEMAKDEGIRVEQVIVNDDVGSGPKEKMANRRGVAGQVIVWKVAGAKAEERASLEEIKKVAERANFNSRTMGVALSPCTVPTAGEPTFTLGEDEMEVGVGEHGEPGLKRMKLKSADETTELLMDEILPDLPFKSGDEVSVLVNGFGATPLLELYIVYRKVAQILQQKNIRIYKSYVGEYVTSLEMGGYSVTLTKLDEELKRLLDTPAEGTIFKQI